MTAPIADDWEQFVTQRLPHIAFQSVEAEDITATAGGLSAGIVRLRVHEKGTKQPHQYIVKRTRVGAEELGVTLGTLREVRFLNTYASAIDPSHSMIPRVVYAALEPDAKSGSTAPVKVVVMEDLSVRHGVQAGHFFNNAGSPHNQGKDLLQLTQRFRDKGVSERDVAVEAFTVAAKMHACFFEDAELLDKEIGYLADDRNSVTADGLRAAGWILGKERDTFEQLVGYAKGCWDAFKERLASQKEAEEEKKEGGGEAATRYVLHDKVREMIDCCFARTNFEDYVAMFTSKQLRWTLVHGDFHPANMMVVDGADETAAAAAADSDSNKVSGRRPFQVMLLDWEVVGVGSGPQDLGQFVVSHVNMAALPAYEADALSAYYDTFTRALADKGKSAAELPSMEDVRREYVAGGLGRWAWLYPACAPVCPAEMMNYFQNQMLSFMELHKMQPCDVGMVRP